MIRKYFNVCATCQGDGKVGYLPGLTNGVTCRACGGEGGYECYGLHTRPLLILSVIFWLLLLLVLLLPAGAFAQEPTPTATTEPTPTATTEPVPTATPTPTPTPEPIRVVVAGHEPGTQGTTHLIALIGLFGFTFNTICWVVYMFHLRRA